MKKILILVVSLVFTILTFSQSISINGPTSVEVGIPYNYSLSFIPKSPYPYNYGGTVQADTYVITEWIVQTGSNGQSNTIPGYINSPSNTGSYYYDGTFNNSSTKTVPIQWGDGGGGYTGDNIIVKVSGYYKKNSTGEICESFNYQPQATLSVIVQRLTAPIIEGASLIPSCNQTNQTYSFSNYTNSNQALWTVSGATIVGPATGTFVVIKPNLTGSYTVYCTIKRSGSNLNYSVLGAKGVGRKPFTSAATISGNATFCSTSSYTLSGLLPNQTVTWSLSKPILWGRINSTTGLTTTVSAGIKQGDIDLIARITSSCGEFAYITKNLTIGVNGLIPILTTPSGYPFTTTGPYNVPEGCLSPMYIFKTSSENTNWNNPTKKMRFTCNGTTIVKPMFGNYYFLLNSLDFNIDEGQVFDVVATVGNSCGFSSTSVTFKLYRPTLCQCGTGDPNDCPILPRMANNGNVIKEKTIFKLYPNPSKDVINIELDNSSVTPIKSNASIYNMFGVQVDNFEILENKATFDVYNYVKGVYILKIDTNGTQENHQIIVK